MRKPYDVDGYFKIASLPTGVYLTVYPPLGDGKKVDLEEVLIQVKNNDKIKDVDFNAIKEAVTISNGTAIKIGEYQSESIGNLLLVEISDDELKAYLTILYPPEGGKVIPIKDIYEELAKRGIVYGIQEDKLAQVLKSEEFNKIFLIAQGILPKNGEDAKITFKFKRNKEYNLEEVGGRVDFKKISPIDIVKENEVIAVKTPATTGIPGITVTGKLIPPKPGKDIPFPKGKNIEETPDGLELKAITNGYLMFDMDKINIAPVYNVDGNVDYSTGNINFPGTVIIKGDVLGGFSVKADGDVIIGGCVENAHVEAKGDIIIKNGILGKNEGYLRALNISANYIEHSRIDSYRDVIVGESIIHSYVNAKHKVIVKGRLGIILGGRIRAGLEIRAKTIGSWAEVLTELEVGIDPQSREEIHQLSDEIAEDKKKLQELKLGIKTLLSLKASCDGNFNQEKKELLTYYLKVHNSLMEKIQDTTERITTLQKRLSIDSGGGQISVFNIMHPGVKISIHNATFRTLQEYKYVTFTATGGKIEISHYKEDTKKPPTQESKRKHTFVHPPWK